MRLTRNRKLRRRKGRWPMSGPPEIARARRKEAVRQAGIEAAKAAAASGREELRQALS